MQGATGNVRSIGRVGVFVAALVGTLALAVAAQAGGFSYPDFSSTDGLDLNGDANASADVLHLTEDAAGETGTAWTEEKLVQSRRSFETVFEYEVTSGGIAADGLAFVLQNEGSSVLGGGGHEMGYGGLGKSVAVEIDYYPNTDQGDPNFQHVGVTKKGDANRHVELMEAPFTLVGERTVWVSYAPGQRKLKVAIAAGHGVTKMPEPLVKARVNLFRVLGKRAHAGFASATGGLGAANDVLSWSLE